MRGGGYGLGGGSVDGDDGLAVVVVVVMKIMMKVVIKDGRADGLFIGIEECHGSDTFPG